MDQVASMNLALVNNPIAADPSNRVKSPMDLIDTTNLQQKQEPTTQTKPKAAKVINGVTPSKGFENGPGGAPTMPKMQKH